MTTLWDRTAIEETTPHPISRPRCDQHHDCWARICAAGGAGAWAGLAVLGRAGVWRVGGIELLFLLAPLVVVPLGMALGRVLEFPSPARARAIDCLVARGQPVAALAAVIAVLGPSGPTAGLLAGTWLVLASLIAISGVAGLISALASRRLPLLWEWALGIARIDLAVGGAWLLISRLGIRPLRMPEPVELLTAVHFHFAGFATATIAAAAVRRAAGRAQKRWLRLLIPVVVGMPFVVAVGFVTLPALQPGAALLFGISIAGLAVCLRASAKTMTHPTSRVLLAVASASVFAAMVLAGAYAIADFRGSDRLTMPQMASTHGLLNGVGFCLPGLLAWLVEMAPAPQRPQ
jgi:hypothetical protein